MANLTRRHVAREQLLFVETRLLQHGRYQSLFQTRSGLVSVCVRNHTVESTNRTRCHPLQISCRRQTRGWLRIRAQQRLRLSHDPASELRQLLQGDVVVQVKSCVLKEKQPLLATARCATPRMIFLLWIGTCFRVALPNRCDSVLIRDAEWDVVASPCPLEKSFVVEVNRGMWSRCKKSGGAARGRRYALEEEGCLEEEGWGDNHKGVREGASTCRER